MDGVLRGAGVGVWGLQVDIQQIKVLSTTSELCFSKVLQHYSTFDSSESDPGSFEQ